MKVKGLFSEFWSQVRQPFFLAYLVKCVIGVSLCYGFYLLFPELPFYWSMISVLLVLAPERHNTVKLSLGRIKANLAGALVGLATYFVLPIELPAIAAAVVVTVLLCTLFRLGNATRSALAALIIVLIQQGEQDSPMSALYRVLCVVAGCVVALLITELFSLLPFLKEDKQQG